MLTVEKDVPRVYFEQLTPTVPPGGVVTGVLVVESDKPLDPNSLRVDFEGAEISFGEERPGGVHFGSKGGRSEAPVHDRRPFLATSQVWDATGQITGSVYRLPFSFSLPPNALPTLRTGTLKLGGHGDFEVFEPPRFGMFVEYSLKGRVVHPHWLDNVEIQSIQVTPPVAPLGATGPLRADAPDGSLTLLVTPDSSLVVPGAAVEGSFQVVNPKRAKFERLNVALVRRIEYVTLGAAHALESPRYEQAIEVPHDESAFGGRFSIPLPKSLDALPPAQGTIFRTEWALNATLVGGFLSEPFAASAGLSPPSPPPPPGGT